MIDFKTYIVQYKAPDTPIMQYVTVGAEDAYEAIERLVECVKGVRIENVALVLNGSWQDLDE